MHTGIVLTLTVYAGGWIIASTADGQGIGPLSIRYRSWEEYARYRAGEGGEWPAGWSVRVRPAEQAGLDL